MKNTFSKKFLRISKTILICLMLLGLNFVNPNFNAKAEPISNDDVVYMILTDRFCDGDSSNNGTLGKEYRPGELKYTQGGDWQGIINKLPYIKSLGVTAIWISPVSQNELLSKDGQESGYHGYFTHDYYKADPHFGSKEKLKELVDKAHANGIKVILDAVPNHTADYLGPKETKYSSESYQPAPPFNNPDWYNHNGDIMDWNNQWQVENCDLGGLDDINHNNPEARKEIINVYKTWVKDMGIDGVRVDAARSIPKEFLKQFEEKLGVPTFGEIFVGDVNYVSDYQKYEWGVLDFPLFFNAREVFAQDASFYKIKNILDQDHKYKDPNKLVTFLDNHDRDRFLCLADDNYDKLRLGMTFLFTARGIPDVYYGTEQACYGGGKPTEWAGIANKENREMMPSFDDNNSLFKHIKRLTDARKNYKALANGTQREMWAEHTVFSYSRRDDSSGQEVITILNNGWDSAKRTIPLRAESSIKVGTVLTNFMNTSEKVKVTSGGITGKQIEVNIPAKSGMILVEGNPSNYTPEAKNITKIRVHYDVGYGNTMYIRGEKYPLWWDQGRKMRNISSDLWEIEIERLPKGEKLEFKPMINDKKWSNGCNYKVTGGETIDVYPKF